MTVQDNKVAFRYRALELDVLAWVLTSHLLKVCDEGLLAISYVGIVLRVGLA